MAPWNPTVSVGASNDRMIPGKSISDRETEAEWIRDKASLLRARSAEGSEMVDPSRGVSWAARQEKENMLQKFHCVAKRLTSSDTTKSAASKETKSRANAASIALHDLCVEANSKDDMAWRNAVTLLAKEPELAQLRTPEGWTPLHICCMGPVPLFMIRCLLYAYAPALAAVDENGRLPLHMLCASPYCDLEILQLIVEEYPAALSTKDHPGIIPLHLFLRNTAVECITERIRILLGWTLSTTATEHEAPAKFRKGQHLQVNVATLEGWRTRSRPVTQINRTSAELDNVTPDVQAAVRQLAPLYVSATEASFINPAAIPDPFEQLPLHILVHRAIILRQPLDSRYAAQYQYDTSDGQPSPSVPHVIIALRILICAYPDALLCCNGSGHTPLSAVLAQSSIAPSAEIIEYLTGTRLQLEQIPAWAHDLPLARDSPATITSEQLQLPLHIAAERWVDHVEIIRSVKEAYPAAIQQKDAKGRTPLHRCLESRQTPVSVDAIELLCNDNVASLQDDRGRTPLQLLRETKQFPYHGVSSSIYRRLIDASPVEDPHQLAILPPWLRSQACSSPAVQAYVLQALSHPVLCSFILLDGLMLVGIIVVLRLQLNDYFDSSETTTSWYTYAVYGTASFRLMLQAVVLALQGGVSALRFWSLTSVIAMLSALATSALMDGTVEEEIILQVGTASSGLLWLATIGYLSTWWYNMALFTGSFLQMANTLFWAVVVVGIICVAGSQMFSTFLLLECDTAIPGTSFCTAKGSFRFVYALMRGEIPQEGEEWSKDAVTLTSALLVLGILWVAAVLLNVVMVALRIDSDEVALKAFWEPQLAKVLAIGLPHRQIDAFCPMERLWNMLTNQREDDDNESKVSNKFNALTKWALGIFLVPLWILAGVVTLGWLWPPQVREWLFRPQGFHKTSRPTGHNTPTSQLSHEVRLVKMMTYDRAMDLERELKNLRELVKSKSSQVGENSQPP
ncbi:hypothetical protein FisN_26Lh080 [Fistulifera solaris]|uniref:Uncharacterized protein n=1 Tax=Fistulifera solaris TaxID=1519565 RepID=A0A1Z5KD15_FISSO|nr:hypothetical protein FisN_26Lh080 [Fistulifera solaris]|eukprot:GAX24012.1 hypothetical protein FisN_26Lh080 [Fistulifera solaris]